LIGVVDAALLVLGQKRQVIVVEGRLETVREPHSVCVAAILGRLHDHADGTRWMHDLPA
jgi:hypothetical protein